MGFFNWTYKAEKEPELTLAEKKVKEAVSDCLNFAKTTDKQEWRQAKEALKAHAIDLELDFRNVIITCINNYAADLHGEHYPMHSTGTDKTSQQNGAKITLLINNINNLTTLRDEVLAGVDSNDFSIT